MKGMNWQAGDTVDWYTRTRAGTSTVRDVVNDDVTLVNGWVFNRNRGFMVVSEAESVYFTTPDDPGFARHARDVWDGQLRADVKACADTFDKAPTLVTAGRLAAAVTAWMSNQRA